ncbi:hypothetical protein [Candidatus Cyanaurora vandensis]|uniref:hypothetical protein n=1 Tax=Candidatus Cyanaurora vandensis TaxID=2714958 RepID=UPI00257F02FC|nr:hypothetical protein [Candidatus Cyanaurora vandensis]
MRFTQSLALVCALLIFSPLVRAEPQIFTPPTLEQTLTCTHAQIAVYTEVASYCAAVVTPYVCNQLDQHESDELPSYMILWEPACDVYKVSSPPPG